MLRRTPLKRTKGLKRSRFKQKPHKPNPAGHDPAHLAWIRSQPCCMCGFDFRGMIDAHHSTVGRGLSRKTSDREAMPLCTWCHRDFHNARGGFDGWTKATRKVWQLSMVSRYRCGEYME